jgi:hypothetical protein
MPIHEIFRARYGTLETRAQVTDTNLDIVIEELVKKHPDMEHIIAYTNQWTKTRKLASWQLLSILGVAITDEDLHLHFDYVSMHIRCATLLSEIRKKFIKSAEVQSQALATRNSETLLTQFLDDREMSLSRLLSDTLMSDEHLAPRTASSIFLAHPAAAAAAQNIDADAPLYSEMLGFAGVSLDRAIELISEVIEREGDVEIKKAGGLCKPIIGPEDSSASSTISL